MLKKVLLTSVLCTFMTIIGVFAEPTPEDLQTVSSKAYVDTQVATKQLKIPAAGQTNGGAGETVMTYTATGNGQIGERGLYSDASNYNPNTDGDKLITASALKDTFTNLPTTDTTKLECANPGTCDLWTIVDQTAYARELPDGYTRLEYIQSTGTQYIDTGIVPKTFDYTITTVASFDSVNSTSTPLCICGYMGSGTLPRWTLASYASQYLFGVNATAVSDVPQDTNKHTFVSKVYTTNNSNNWKATIDGTVVRNMTIPSPETFTANTLSIYLFARNNSGTAGNEASGKIYHHTVEKDGVIIQDLIPCKRISDNVLGMYDTVSGTLFTNAATSGDDFTAGPAI